MIRQLKFFLFIITGISLQGCWTTYYGKASKNIEGKIVELKVFWNSFCGEPQLTKKFEFKVNELMEQSNNYQAYLILYQTNNSLREGKRKFTVHFFRDNEEKSEFIKMTDTEKQEFQSLQESESFKKSWNSLHLGQKLEDTFILFPELKKYYLKQDFEYESNLIYRLQNVEFIFDRDGRLIAWRK